MPSTPAKGQVIFYENCPPPLLSGRGYSLKVGQAVTRNGTSIDAGSTKKIPGDRTHDFEIAGPRFSLNPNEIHAAYPPPEAQGPFEGRLPMVVLSRRTLPWERALDPSQTSALEPWLALLLFEESEVIELDPPTCTVGHIVDGDSSNGVASIRRQFSDLTNADLARPCLGVQVQKSTFKAIAPTREEVKLLAHARQVNTEDKELLGQDKDGWFSVVVSNRLPVSGKKYVACLVSLEGQLSNLPTLSEVPVRTSPPQIGGHYVLSEEVRKRRELMAAIREDRAPDLNFQGETQQSQIQRINREEAVFAAESEGRSTMAASSAEDLQFQLTDGELTAAEERLRYKAALRLDYAGAWMFAPVASVRLICLARWRFTCEGKGDFEALMKALPSRGGIAMLGMNQDAATRPETVPKTSLKVSLDSGHVPVDHLTRAGEKATALYRGPLVPAGVKARKDGPYHTADQARGVDPLSGLENLGYASAFEIGRLMALADPRFALELLQWRRNGHRRVVTGLRDRTLRLNLSEILPEILDPRLLLDPSELVDPSILVKELLGDLAPRLLDETLVGPRTDPSGLRDMQSLLPGLDANRVFQATGFAREQIELMFGAPVTGGSSVLGTVGIQDVVTSDAGFESVLGRFAQELGYLSVERNKTLGDIGGATPPGGTP